MSPPIGRMQCGRDAPVERWTAAHGFDFASEPQDDGILLQQGAVMQQGVHPLPVLLGPMISIPVDQPRRVRKERM